jgi:N6-adenosine-specific RNA methylase IME4
MREMIAIVSYEPRLELFAREAFVGWNKWGNEVTSDIVLGGALPLSLVA